MTGYRPEVFRSVRKLSRKKRKRKKKIGVPSISGETAVMGYFICLAFT